MNLKLSFKETQSSGDFEAVTKYVESEIIGNGKVVSMKTLQEIHGTGIDNRYRHKLKQRLKEKYADNITFFQPNQQCVEVVLRTNNLTEVMSFMTDTDKCLKEVARRLRSDLLNYCDKIGENSWPPTIESVREEYGEPPASVQLFLSCVLRDNEVSKRQKTNKTDTLSRLIESFTADLVNAVSRGKILTPKHYLVGLGVHNMTGQKTPVTILNKLGHSISYTKVCDIETSLAEHVVEKAENFNVLPLLPEDEEMIIPTWFWTDNFDVAVEKQMGESGSIHTTHLMAFQEVSDDLHVKENDTRIPLDKPKSRRISKAPTGKDEPTHKVNVNAEPPYFNKDTPFGTEFNEPLTEKFWFWVIFRHHNAKNQMIPNFSGWLLQQRQAEIPISSLKQTTETYLPPIVSKVTEFKTIETYFEYLQMLSKQCNMPYTNITLDVGAAINAFKFLWSNQSTYQNIVIHLGDFHFMKENFQVSINDFSFVLVRIIMNDFSIALSSNSTFSDTYIY